MTIRLGKVFGLDRRQAAKIQAHMTQRARAGWRTGLTRQPASTPSVVAQRWQAPVDHGAAWQSAVGQPVAWRPPQPARTRCSR
jgi:hypothetical protein